MWFVLASSLMSWKDRTLQMRASRVEGLLSSFPQQREDMLLSRLDELAGLLPEGQLIQIRDTDGHQLFPLDIPASAPVLPFATCPVGWTQNISVAKDSYRRLCHPITLQGRQAFLFVSTSLIEDQILLGNFTSALYKITPILLLISSIGGYLLSRRALHPVTLLIAEAKTITARDLSHRLPVPLADDELRRLAIEWNNLLARIQRAMEQVTQFTADASHELRNPIAFIRTTAQFHLQDPNLEVDAREGFQEIVTETQGITQLLENLLLLARMDSGSVPANTDDIEVDAAITDVLRRMESMAHAKQLSLVYQPADKLSLNFRIDLLHFRSLLTIVLENAIKFTPAGGTVTVTRETSTGLSIHVADTGIGIGEDDLTKVFDRFYRVDAARTEGNEGTGLGLPIAKWLAELYGGHIAIKSELNIGTIVTIFLPM